MPEDKKIEQEREIRAMLADIERNGLDAAKAVKEFAAKDAERGKAMEDLLKRVETVEARGKHRTIPAVDVPGAAEATHEGRTFSMSRYIDAIASKDWSRAGLELEISRAAAKEALKQAGTALDTEDKSGARVMLTTSDVSAGFLVPTQVMAGMIPKLYKATVVRELGATVMPNLQGSPVEFLKHTGGVSGGHIDEGSSMESSAEDLTFGKVLMTPKRAFAFSKVSNRMLRMSNPALDALINDDLAKALARVQDLAALQGTGSSNAPLGIANFPGRNDADAGSPDGGEVTYELLCNMIYELEADDALDGKLAWAFHPTLRNKLAKLLDADDRPLFQWDPSVAQPTKNLVGYPWKTTTAIPIDLTKGNGTNLTRLYFANWADLMIGEWGGLMLDASREAGDSFVKDLTFVRIMSDYDVAPRREESFCVSDEVETT